MKSDADLKRDVEAELDWDPAIKSSAIGVSVKSGIVTLTGHIETYSEKWAVERAVKRVGGVKAIALEMDVRLSPAHLRSDTDIAEAAELALKWHTLVPTDAVRITVDNGWITLQGNVEWDFERKAVESAVRDLKGVVGLSNEIHVRQRPTSVDLTRRIQEALTRQAVREAHHIEVASKDGTVTLRGTVHSWHEREAAQGAAWSAPGVRVVINELKIG